MLDVDIKRLLRKLNRFSTRSLEAAAGLCVSRGHYEVGIPHLLAQMAEDPHADFQIILRSFEVEPARLQKALQREMEGLRSGNPGKPVFSTTLLEWLQEAWLIGSIDLGLTEIRSGTLLVALIGKAGRYIGDAALEILEAIRLEALKQTFFEITGESSEQAAQPSSEKGAAVLRGDETALGRFTLDFTEQARRDEMDPVFGRDREIRQMIDILARRRKNNPIVVGEAGVGKTAVVEGLALKVIQQDVPDVLKGVTILGLDMGLLQAGAGVKGEFENRLKSVISEVKASPKPIILFIDEAHTLIGAGGAAGMSDAANLLKPALARGELRTIAATTWSEYKKYFEKDAALARRFQPVSLDEPSEENAVIILRGLRERYEASHQVSILDDAVVAAAKLSSRYISGRQLPDKAVDLLDTAAARVKIGLTHRPAQLEEIERGIAALRREQAAYARDRAAGAEADTTSVQDVETKIADLEAERTRLEARWKEEQEAADRVRTLRGKCAAADDAERESLQNELKGAREALVKLQGAHPLIKVEVDAEVIAHVISDWTGIPAGKMVQDEAHAILALSHRMGDRIKGQDQAIEVIARGIRAAKAGLGDPNAPMGVFLLVGPSGVGKTETALGLADLLLGGERSVVTINMSEFQEKHTVSKLIGSPPGYVGYGEGGVLTEAVRRRPYSVVLLDEVEKADPEVLNLFYEVFDKGTLSDGEGRAVPFKNTVILLTSNLASDLVMQACSDGSRPALDDLVAVIRPVLSRHFKPALLARMTIVPYYPVDPAAMREIVELKLRRVGKQLMENQRMVLEYDPAVVEQMAQRCTEVETGARNVDHILRGTLLPKISTEILNRMAAGPFPKRLKVGIGTGGEFSLEFGEE